MVVSERFPGGLCEALGEFEQADDGGDADKGQEDDVHTPQNEAATRAAPEAPHPKGPGAVRTFCHRSLSLVGTVQTCHESALVFKFFCVRRARAEGPCRGARRVGYSLLSRTSTPENPARGRPLRHVPPNAVRAWGYCEDS